MTAPISPKQRSLFSIYGYVVHYGKKEICLREKSLLHEQKLYQITT